MRHDRQQRDTRRAMILGWAQVVLMVALCAGPVWVALPWLVAGGAQLRIFLGGGRGRSERREGVRRLAGTGPQAASQSLASLRAGDTMAIAGPDAAGLGHTPVAVLRFGVPVDREAITQRPLYLRVHTFDTFFADGWFGGDRGAAPVGERGAEGELLLREDLREGLRYTVFMRPMPSGILPLLSMPVSVEVPEALRTVDDVCILGTELHAPFVSYSASSLPLHWDGTASDGISPARAPGRYHRAPAGSERAALDALLARAGYGIGTVVRGLGPALGALREGFGYSRENAAPAGTSAIEHFLSEEGREGNCRAFATAFALMARLLGYPSRIVVGYCGGELAVDQGVVTFFADEGHAWVEVFTGEFGWLTVDPTPASDGAPPYRPRPPSRALVLDTQAFPDVAAALRAERALAAAADGRRRAGPSVNVSLVAGLLLGLSVLASLAAMVWGRVSAGERAETRSSMRERRPRFLRLLLRRLAKAGHPMARGQTFREYIMELQGRGVVGEGAQAIVEYVYGVCYAGATRSSGRERELLASAIQGDESSPAAGEPF